MPGSAARLAIEVAIAADTVTINSTQPNELVVSACVASLATKRRPGRRAGSARRRQAANHWRWIENEQKTTG